MTTNTMVALRSTTLASSASSVTLDLTGITGYTDLVLVVSAKSNTSTLDYTQIQFNNDGGFGNLYSRTYLGGNGSSAYSGRNTSTTAYSDGYLEATASGIYAPTIFNIMNYANTTTYKTILSNGVSSNTGAGAIVGLWRNLNAINRIDVSSVNGNGFAAGSTFTLYGIANADIGAYATGGIITQDSTYYYHAFGSSGTFTPSRALTADILVVAGGGGGADDAGCGAGGVLANAAVSLASGTSYTCSVGAGGAGNRSSVGASGSNSNVTGGSLSLTAAVGGGGGGWQSSPNGINGGSGGGASCGNSTTVNTAGTGSQGHNGGTNAAVTFGGSGGGGGSGTNGYNGSGYAGGNGGDGVNTVTNWGALAALVQATGYGVNGYIAAGGGGGGGYSSSNSAGGNGGLGGGGNGGVGTTASTGTSGTAGTPNTGSGGGGGGAANSTDGTGGNGASGLIVLRYAK